MEIKRLISAIFSSLLLLLGVNILSEIALDRSIGFFFLLFFPIVYLFYKQESIKHIWRRTFIILSIESFLMPFAGIVSIILSSAMKGNEMTRFVVGFFGGIMVLILAFIGVSLGLIFLLIGRSKFKIPNKPRR